MSGTPDTTIIPYEALQQEENGVLVFGNVQVRVDGAGGFVGTIIHVSGDPPENFVHGGSFTIANDKQAIMFAAPEPVRKGTYHRDGNQLIID